MNNTAYKTNNIKKIPTELNFYYNTNKRINRLRKQGNTSRLLILTLIIWNLFLTIPHIHFNHPNIPQFSDVENELIMQLEEIPTEQLKF